MLPGGGQGGPRWPGAAAGLAGAAVWDGVFFVRVARCGYEYEQMHAFFPLLPLLMRLLHLSGVALDVGVCAVFATYTESLFAALSFAGMWHFVQCASWRAAALFMLSGATRWEGGRERESEGEREGGERERGGKGARQRQTWRSSLRMVLVVRLASTTSTRRPRRTSRWATSGVPVGKPTVGGGLANLAVKEKVEPTPSSLSTHMRPPMASARRDDITRPSPVPNFVLASPMLALSLAAIASYARARPSLFLSLGFSLGGRSNDRLSKNNDSTSDNNDGNNDKDDANGNADDDENGIYYGGKGKKDREEEEEEEKGDGEEGEVEQLLMLAPGKLRRLSSPVKFELFSNKGRGKGTSEGKGMAETARGGHGHGSGAHVAARGGLRRRRHLGGPHLGPPSPLITEGTCDVAAAATAAAAGGKGMDRAGGFYSPAVLCPLYQLAFMTAVSTLVMHVQVTTRFLSVCAPIYWFGAHLILESGAGSRSYLLESKETAEKENSSKFICYLIWGSFIAYTLVGTLLFVNFYPFT
eukprot:jgi/Mesen1/9109/ME000058S08608